jgi:hypothetical protein
MWWRTYERAWHRLVEAEDRFDATSTSPNPAATATAPLACRSMSPRRSAKSTDRNIPGCGDGGAGSLTQAHPIENWRPVTRDHREPRKKLKDGS